MKLHTRRHLGGNRYEVTVSLEASEATPFVGQTVGSLEEMGSVAIDQASKARGTWLTPEDRLHVLEVRTLETVGRLVDK